MSRGATARLFVAAELPLEVREELASWARQGHGRGEPGAAPLRLLGVDTLHVTLCFLGARPVGEIAAIAAALEPAAAPVGELSLGAPLWLPPSRPRALAVAINDEQSELAVLQARLAGAIAEVTRWRSERRRFRAHVTVARTRGESRRSAAGTPVDGGPPATPALRFTPESITLYRSWLSPARASYEALAACTLLPAGM